MFQKSTPGERESCTLDPRTAIDLYECVCLLFRSLINEAKSTVARVSKLFEFAYTFKTARVRESKVQSMSDLFKPVYNFALWACVIKNFLLERSSNLLVVVHMNV